MKMKLLLGCSLSALLSINCYALEIHNGHLIKHKEWTTGGAKMLVKEGVNHRAQQKLNEKKMASGVYTGIFSSLDSNSNKGIVSTPIDVKSSHQIYVMNDTEQTHQYDYIFSVCAHIDNHQTQCGYYADSVELQPGGYVSVDEEPALQVIINKIGTYDITSSTGLGQEDDDTGGSYSNSTSNGIMNVVEK